MRRVVPVHLAILVALVACAVCGARRGSPLLSGEDFSHKNALAGVERGKPVVLAVLLHDAYFY